MFLRSAFCRAVTTILVPLLLFLPVLPNLAQAQLSASPALQSTSAETEDLASACNDGRADAERNVGGVWFFAGCLGIIGVLIAFLVEPTPPSMKIMGKSPQYIAMYTDCYRSAGKSAQGKKAVTGCLVIAAVEVVIYVIYIVVVIAAINSSEPY